MGFAENDIRQLLVACHRRCCVCHRYCGVRMEVDHIIPKAENGTDEPDNAIAVCFDCHAEIHHYNPAHPKGRRFSPEELKGHRDQWLAFCASNPGALASTVPPAEGGALERLLNELMFNEQVSNASRVSALFEVAQFRRAIGDGTLSWLKADQRDAVNAAYTLIFEINNRSQGLASIEHAARHREFSKEIVNLLTEARTAIVLALDLLRNE